MSEPLIVITDPPELPKDTRCPKCGSVERKRSETFGPVHDVCAGCWNKFDELTVPEAEAVDEEWGFV